MIIPIASASVLVKVLVTNGMTSAKFGEQTQLKGMKIKGMTRINTGSDDISTVDSQKMFLTLKIGTSLHFDKFPVEVMERENGNDIFSITSEKPIDWANSLIEWKNALAGLSPDGKYISFLVLYERAK